MISIKTQFFLALSLPEPKVIAIETVLERGIMQFRGYIKTKLEKGFLLKINLRRVIVRFQCRIIFSPKTKHSFDTPVRRIILVNLSFQLGMCLCVINSNH